MCGLGGYVSFGRYLGVYDLAVKDLLYMLAMRGMDSTGVAVINTDETFVHKKALNAADFFDTKGWSKARGMCKAGSIVMVHARSATRGSIKNENAHPFETDNLILTHNGSLNSHYNLNSGITSDVDSCHIAHAMDRHGAQETLAKLNGSAVCTWFDHRDTTFNIARTKDRNVYWCYDENDTLWYGSEWEMVHTALARHGIKIKNAFVFPPTYHWFSWNMAEGGKLSATPFPEYKYQWEETSRPFGMGNGGQGTSTAKQSESTTVSSTIGSPPTTTPTIKPKWKPNNSTALAIYETTNKSTVDKINHKLRVFNLKVGDCIGVRPIQFHEFKQTPKNKDKLGVMVCNIVGKSVRVKVYETPEEEYRTALEYVRAREPYYVNVINISKDETTNETYIIGKLCPDEQVALQGPKDDDPSETSAYVCGPGRVLIPEDEFYELTKEGCQMCTDNISVNQAQDIRWLGGDTGRPAPLCKNCAIDMKVA